MKLKILLRTSQGCEESVTCNVYSASSRCWSRSGVGALWHEVGRPRGRGPALRERAVPVKTGPGSRKAGFLPLSFVEAYGIVLSLPYFGGF